MAFPGDKENLGDVVCSAWGGSAACLVGGGWLPWPCRCGRFQEAGTGAAVCARRRLEA